jgi:murein L,D-transpeptidase YafK
MSSRTFVIVTAVELVVLAGMLVAWIVRSGHSDVLADAPKPVAEIHADGQALSNSSAGEKAGPADPNESPQTSSARPAFRQDRPLPVLDEPRIVIEKSRLRLSVYDGDRLVKRYPAAVGAEPGPKRREGDLRTPEGDYYVCIRKSAGQTPYTRSLGLSYPNADDAARGLAEGRISKARHDEILRRLRRGGIPDWYTPLGGEIMIHGKRLGGRATQGCIALEDEDVIELFSRIPLGTPVRILP